MDFVSLLLLSYSIATLYDPVRQDGTGREEGYYEKSQMMGLDTVLTDTYLAKTQMFGQDAVMWKKTVS